MEKLTENEKAVFIAQLNKYLDSKIKNFLQHPNDIVKYPYICLNLIEYKNNINLIKEKLNDFISDEEIKAFRNNDPNWESYFIELNYMLPENFGTRLEKHINHTNTTKNHHKATKSQIKDSIKPGKSTTKSVPSRDAR